ncbi:hypothetical protein [Actinomadura harenae]|uniref:Uncharacterized protein n=1 Tax=Actinomadura harenae TaxID=2483351 RepID=A0A3M2LS38_9ACTN|nr:hypothetical protein [Actinomadura harenae]RMI39892.1 hypothetical protein EBO15_28415 [Actinomadura harenae]RMI39896.1 hypothetical protein EBO15_28435 [Actinomadura harenae]
MIDDDAPHILCPWPTVCRCTHHACVDGWLDRTRDDGTAYAAPCPNCRPEVHRHLADRSKSMRRLRRELPDLPRPSRNTGRRVEEAH